MTRLKMGFAAIAMLATANCFPSVTFAQAQSQSQYAEQKSCGTRALSLFGRPYNDKEDGELTESFTYENHFNARLNRCVVLWNKMEFNNQVGTIVSEEWGLVDAYEQTAFGSYMKGSGNVAPLSCFVKGFPSCTDSRSFQTAARTYLTN